jgi:hypothetical protein
MEQHGRQEKVKGADEQADALTCVVGVAIGAQVVDADARAYLYLTRNASVWVCLVYVETVDVSTDMENDFEPDCEEEG